MKIPYDLLARSDREISNKGEGHFVALIAGMYQLLGDMLARAKRNKK